MCVNDVSLLYLRQTLSFVITVVLWCLRIVELNFPAPNHLGRNLIAPAMFGQKNERIATVCGYCWIESLNILKRKTNRNSNKHLPIVLLFITFATYSAGS